MLEVTRTLGQEMRDVQKEQEDFRQKQLSIFAKLMQKYDGTVTGLEMATGVFSPDNGVDEIYKVAITRMCEDIQKMVEDITAAMKEEDPEELRNTRNKVFLRETLLGMWDYDIAELFKLLIEAKME